MLKQTDNLQAAGRSPLLRTFSTTLHYEFPKGAVLVADLARTEYPALNGDLMVRRGC